MANQEVSREIFEAIMKEMVGTFRPSRDNDDPFRTPRSAPRTQRYDNSFESDRYSRSDASLHSSREEYRATPDSRRTSYGTTPAARSVEVVRSPYYAEPRRSRSPHRSDDYYYNNRTEGRDREFTRPRDSSWSDERDYRRQPPRRDDSYRKPEASGQARNYARQDVRVSRGRQAFLERRQAAAAGKPQPQPRGGVAARGGSAERGQRGGVSPRGPTRGGVAGRGVSRGGFAGRGAAAGVQPSQRGGRGAMRGKPNQRGASAQRGRGNQNQGPGRQGVVNGKKQGPKREDKFAKLMAGGDAFSKLSNKIVKWAGFNKLNSGDFDQKNPAYITLQTQTFANALASFKCALKPELRYQCFLSVKAPNHAALKKPIVDSDFVSLLVDKGVVENRKEFSDIINPLDKYLTSFQQCILKSIHPLLLACNAYELNMKHGFPGATDLSKAYESAVALCRKSLVLFGQTYSIAASLRQEKILEHVGLQDMAPKPTDFPNLEDSALFGKQYMTQLKAWLEKGGYPMHLQSQARKPKESIEDLTPEPTVKEMMDSLLENAVDLFNEKKRTDTEGDATDATEEKPELWYLFDETSQEFKYYQQKLDELRKLHQAEADAKREQLKAAAAVSLAAKSGPSNAPIDPQFADVDQKTRETAENLARFMIQLGSDIEDFNMDSLTNNPDFWFLTKKDSTAHKFYQMKLTEIRDSPNDAKDGDQPTITEDSDEEHKGTEVDQDNEMDSEQASQVVMEVECETVKSVTSTPSQALPQKKRAPQKATRAATPKKASADEPKSDDPVKTGNEKPTGRAGLRKKQKLNDDHASEDSANKSTAASGDEDSVSGQQSNEDSLGVPE